MLDLAVFLSLFGPVAVKSETAPTPPSRKPASERSQKTNASAGRA